MERYSSYKDSGVQWIGEIPSHWEIIKLKNIVYPIKSGGTPKSVHDDFYSDTGTPWVAIGDMSSIDYLYKTSKCVTSAGIDNKKLTIFPKGTLLYSIYATLGKVCTLEVPATINQAILAINVRITNYNQSFLKYFLKAFELNLKTLSNSNTQSNLNAETVKNIKVLMCPKKEQDAIVSYLDAATSKLDSAILYQQKMIALLNERKQIIIHHAVTKGLDPDVKMKDSGVEWIGMVPEGWEVQPLKRYCRIKTGKTPSTAKSYYFEEGNINWFTPRDLNNFILTNSERKVTNRAQHDAACCMYPANSVYLVGIGGTIGKVGYSEQEASCNQQINVIIPDKDHLYYKYLAYFLQGSKIQVYKLANLSTLPIINQERTAFLLTVIPNVEEQKQIVNFIEKTIKPINDNVEICNRQISLLQERKQIIINEVVKGRVKVCSFK